jgi:hypothetical protein
MGYDFGDKSTQVIPEGGAKDESNPAITNSDTASRDP